MSELKEVSEALRQAHAKFADAVKQLRPDLHRYCSRMTGSVLDGEDLVQETLAQAAHQLSLRNEAVELRPWLFTIAHRRCVDFLRARSARAAAVLEDLSEAGGKELDVAIADRQLAGLAFSHLVRALPPKERAAVILREVLGHSLAETAAILETSEGGVKSALHRGREKLSAFDPGAKPALSPPSPETARYLEAFNQRDWARLTTLMADEVECELVDFIVHRGRETIAGNYLATYGRLPFRWRMVWTAIEGEPAIVCLAEGESGWRPRHALRLSWKDGRVVHIRDYAHVDYLFDGARLGDGDLLELKVVT